jgi:hypothetical protein
MIYSYGHMNLTHSPRNVVVFLPPQEIRDLVGSPRNALLTISRLCSTIRFVRYQALDALPYCLKSLFHL